MGKRLHLAPLAVAIPAAALALATFLMLPSAATAQSRAARPTPTTVLRAMEISSVRIQQILDEVRRAQDQARVSCVDARLSELHGAMRLATERALLLQRATAAGDRTRADHARSVLTRLAERAQIVEREARACVEPEQSGQSGHSRLVVTVEANVPRDALVDTSPRIRPAEAYTR